ncbi:DUF1566 domain-containing protein, partial [Methylophaga muralis]|uniref:Lcl C-terminal domain-containing protein n=1 Tax=Methylophaga muralis TaxID=291169 RepID=UPI000A9EF2E8
ILAYQTSVQAKPLIDQRYSDNGDGTITDTKTNLIWQRCSLGQTWTGETCAGSADGYNWPSAMKQVKDGWRLPTVDELDTLVLCTSNERSISRSYEGINSRCSGDYQEPTINTLAFPKTPEYFFWSSSEYVDENGGHNGWAISFRHGLVGPYHSNFMRDAHVRLVRDLRKTQ